MSSTYREKGFIVQYYNPSSSVTLNPDNVVVVVSGSNGQVGVVQDAIPPETEGGIAIKEVHELVANTAKSWAQGVLIYWDATNLYLTNVSTGNTLAGRAAAPYTGTGVSGGTQTTAFVDLNCR